MCNRDTAFTLYDDKKSRTEHGNWHKVNADIKAKYFTRAVMNQSHKSITMDKNEFKPLHPTPALNYL